MQIYIHIPFCKSKCQYCDFNSYACQTDATIFSYLIALNREIRYAGEKYHNAQIDTIYIGGGTPSLLLDTQITALCKVLKESFDLSGVKEFSIECNPESITAEKLQTYKNLGINRISIGVQSLDDRNLKSIGRLHNASQAIEKIKLANEYFNNVSCDLIIGLPYDTNGGIQDEINMLAPLVKHISMYELTIESGTPLAKRVEEGRIILPDDDEVATLFDVAMDTVAKYGFERYEVSNFARKGYISKHNFGYWQREEYLGIGAGAHSFVKTTDGQTPLANQIRFASPKDINAYIAGINCVNSFDDVPRTDFDVLNDIDVVNEKIMLGLRTTKGIERKLIEKKISNDIAKFFDNDGNLTHLTREGMSVMNSILVKIIDI